MGKLTPMMQQYMLLKEEYSDCLLFYRLGDFYEMFFEDALTASKELEIVLTSRDCGLEERAPMCGVPYHSVDNYIKTLIDKGYKVAICEQLTDPAESKGLVERGVVRVITPGTIIDEQMMESDSNNYIMSLCVQGNIVGIAWSDVSTGEFFLGRAGGENLHAVALGEINRVEPSELITDDATYMLLADMFSDFGNKPLTRYPAYAFERDNAVQALKKQFGESVLDGRDKDDAGICAAGALIEYLHETQKVALSHINKAMEDKAKDYMELDAGTRRNLELTNTLTNAKGRKGTLLGVLNHCKTAPGSRKLKRWLEKPLQDETRINLRLDSVAEIVEDYQLRDDLRFLLDDIYDIERLCSKLSYDTLNAREAYAIGRALEKLPELKQLLCQCKSHLLMETGIGLDVMEELCQTILSAVIENPPLSVREGGLIREGYSEEVDKLRAAYTQGKDWLADLERQEREATGIKNLKIGFNRVFGYYIEITKSNLENVPYRYIRKQTLANAERYITDELKQMEDTILGSEEKCMRLEYQLFAELRDYMKENLQGLQRAASAIALCDCLQSLAVCAFENGYTRPLINTQGRVYIKEGRHPVVDRVVSSFVPNDATIDTEDNRFLIITGPNMSGKSTYMRQVAIITIMAHIGSFVPAKEADISIVDRVFTRVGASDDLASGRSTFMVEMVELANILNYATKSSLVILDEIGRGTSTFDGLSIAWAASEYISNPENLGCKTLFATHYHELTELEGMVDGVKNYCILARETADDVIFLHRIVRGGTDKSFGIQVAKLAGVPDAVVQRSKALLEQLRRLDVDGHITGANEASAQQTIAEQTGLFGYEDYRQQEILQSLRDIDISAITPLEAMNILNMLKDKADRI